MTPTAETGVPPTPVTTESLSETISGWNDTRLLLDNWLMFPVWTVATVSATPTGPASQAGTAENSTNSGFD